MISATNFVPLRCGPVTTMVENSRNWSEITTSFIEYAQRLVQ